MKSELVGLKGELLSGVDMEAALWEEVRERGSCSVLRGRSPGVGVRRTFLCVAP